MLPIYGHHVPLVPPYIESLEPYKPGKPIAELQRELGIADVLKLASNENPLGPSPNALKAMDGATADLNLYPNGGLDLREELARQYNLRIENVIAGSGSEGIMSNIIRTFLCDDDEVLTSEGTFVGFYVLARSRGIRMITVPLKQYHFDLEALAARITPHTKIIYLANPNNPTGTIFMRPEFDQFMKSVPSNVLIILDEAYFEYARDNPSYPDSMHYRYDNVITLRTFSKVYGLAGIRIGYGFAHDSADQEFAQGETPLRTQLARSGRGDRRTQGYRVPPPFARSECSRQTAARRRTPAAGILDHPYRGEFLLPPTFQRRRSPASLPGTPPQGHHHPATERIRVAALRPHYDRDRRTK